MERSKKVFEMTSSGATPAFIRLCSMQDETPSPSDRGSVMWYASQVTPPPRYSTIIGASRFMACSKLSMTFCKSNTFVERY